MLIEVCHEQVDRLVFAELAQTRKYLLEDMERRSPNLFSCNEVYDKMQIQKHIDALDILLEWYREP